MRPPGINSWSRPLRFFFTVTLDRPDFPDVSPLSASRARCRWC
jgi:hypothetical protein